MGNRRSYWRANANDKITCQVLSQEGKDYMEYAVVADISPAGISFICDKDIPEGTPIKIKINFSGAYLDKESNVLAKVARSHKFKDKFKIGCYYIRKKSV